MLFVRNHRIGMNATNEVADDGGFEVDGWFLHLFLKS